MGIHEDGAMPSLRACGARPSAGCAVQSGMASRQKPGDEATGGFLGGTRSARRRGSAGRKPGHLMITDGRAKGSWPKRDNIWVGVMSTLRACGARPSAESAIRAKMASRCKARGWR
jgi:hypothetical protein